MIMDGNAIIYKFGTFTFKVKEYNLKKGDKELYLRPKTYETLLYLIEHHGNLVKKEELIDAVWSDIIVTENTLTQCIKEIREKLNDSSTNPKYVKTISRVGYKFIAPVKEVIVSQYSSQDNLIKTTSIGSRLIKHKIGFTLLFILLASIIFFIINKNISKLNFIERNWVLISDFDNRTGEEVFEAALQTALELELSESKYVNVVPRGRVQDVLTLMRQKPDIRIDRDLGREICLRDGNIQILLTGSIYNMGNRYILSLKIIEPATNRIKKVFSQTVSNREEILPVISQLAISIRKELGESFKNFPDTLTHFEKVTTSSLKALNYYSKGSYYINLFDFNKAEYFLNQAVQNDTSFAMSYTLLGFTNLWLSNLQKGKANFEKAAQLADNLSEREKLFILGTNAMYGNGDYEKGIEYYELLLIAYPDDYWGNVNLSLAYLGNGDIKKYVEYKKICEKLRPNYFINYSDNGLFSLYYDRNIHAANKEFSRALELNPDYPLEFPYLTGLFLDWMHDDIDSAKKKISVFLSSKVNKLLPMAQITSRWFISRFFLLVGKFNEATNILRESIALSQKYDESNLLQWSQLELALTYLNNGRIRQFESIIKNIISNSAGILKVQGIGWLAITYVKNGKISYAKKLLNEIKNENILPPFGVMQTPLPKELEKAKLAFLYQIKGEIANSNTDYKKAIEYFSKVVELVPSSQLPTLTALNPLIRWTALRSLAQIYEKMENRVSAIAAYQDIINNKILTITVPAASNIWFNSLLSISKNLEKQGDDKMSKFYQDKYKRLQARK